MVSTDRTFSDSRVADVIVHKASDGTIYADGVSGDVSSGTDAATVIQAAIDSLPTDGGVVLVKSGRYTISTSLSPVNNLTLKGVGKSTIFETDGSTTPISGDTVKEAEFHDFRIELGANALVGLKIVDPRIVTVDNVDFVGGGVGVFFDTTTKPSDEDVLRAGHKIRDCYFTGQRNGTQNTAIRLLKGSCEYSEVTDNNIVDAEWGVNTNTDNLTVSDNSIANCNIGVRYVGSPTKGIVSNNKINHMSEKGVELSGTRVTVEGNHFLIIGKEAVYLNGGFGYKVDSNLIQSPSGDSDATYDAITVDGATKSSLTDNICEVNSGDGADPANAINEINSAQNNHIHGNKAEAGGFSLNSGDVGENSPEATFDAAPATPENYCPIVATSTWDPDGDSAGEIVVTDDGGTTWQEVAPLPNT